MTTLTMTARFADADVSYLPEWIEYHALVGFERFILMHHGGDGKLPPLLSRYAHMVETHAFGHDLMHDRSSFEIPLRICREDGTRWLAFLDVDEFLLPLAGDSVPDVLRDYEDYGGLVVGWRLFGSSGLQRRPAVQIDAFRRRAAGECIWFKSIVRPERVQEPAAFPHAFSYLPPFFAVNEHQHPVRLTDFAFPMSRMAINHYVVRSAEEMAEKRRRWAIQPNLNGDRSWSGRQKHWADRNEIHDDAICRFVPRLSDFVRSGPGRELAEPATSTIPRVFHRIWLGGAMPAEYARFGETWRAMHPGWEMRHWDESSLPTDGMVNSTQFAASADLRQKADILRYEILFRHGGVYLDCDFECLRSIEDLVAGTDAFAASEDGRWITNAIIGCAPGHGALARVVSGLPSAFAAGRDVYERTGPKFLTAALKDIAVWAEHGSPVPRVPPGGVLVFPKESFYPYHYTEKRRRGETFQAAYAVHHWGGGRRPAGNRTTTETTRLSVVIPTVSRPTLARALRSLGDQALVPGDEILVIGDGRQPVAEAMFRASGLPGRYVEVPGPHGDWGHTPRNLAMGMATGDYIMALDDDDIYADGALATVRAALLERPGVPHMFRMTIARGRTVRILWNKPELVVGNVGTPMFVVPVRGPRGCFAPRYGGDLDFIRSTMALWPPGSLAWRPEVIAVVRPAEPLNGGSSQGSLILRHRTGLRQGIASPGKTRTP